ncbi:MAG: SufD family Fe-S cluster assembly protein [Marinicella sp.]|nr:SufD family Fe-S cluster assembly protein [Xanthomonadales bacterium]
MAGLINNWQEQAKQLINKTESDWLKSVREQALSKLSGLQEPNRKLELWRYADANRLSQSIAAAAEPRPENPLSSELTEQALVIRISENGFELSTDCPDWLKIKNIQQISENQWQEMIFSQETVVNLANVALFNAGVNLEVQSSAAEQELVIVYDFKDQDKWQYVSNRIELPEHAKVKITEQYKAGRLNLINVYHISDRAELIRLQDFRLTQSEQVVSFNQFEIASQASVTNMHVHMGGSIQHHLHRVNFNGNEAKYKSGSINKSFDNNNISDLVEVNHLYKNNESDVTHRSIAKDRSQIFNNAKALVAPGADQSEIEQDLKNILLSEDAKIFSKPELEVYADEVVAAHGSTIGALDEQSLFYLQSRGISIEQAREIMIESFEQEALVC